MKNLFVLLILSYLVFFLSGLVFGQVNAATLKFDKTAVTVNANETFQIAVIVDSGTEQISSTDAYVLYDATLLEAQSVAAGSFFPTVTNNITSGKVYIAAFVDDPATYKTDSGTIATITFKTLKNGSGNLTFDCPNGSKIVKNDLNATNIIECSQNGTSSVSVGGAGTGATTYPTPSVLPQTGIFANIAKAAIPGMILIMLGGMLRLVL